MRLSVENKETACVPPITCRTAFAHRPCDARIPPPKSTAGLLGCGLDESILVLGIADQQRPLSVPLPHDEIEAADRRVD
jgi:hypothetical protein